MVIYKEEHYRDMLDSLMDILDQDMDNIPFDARMLKKELENNYRKDHILLCTHGFKDDIKTMIENLQEISSLMDEIEVDIEEYDEKKREEYTSAFHRMFSLP